MRRILFLIFIFISLHSFAQNREKLQGTWIVRNADSSSKRKMEIEFQFKKKEDWIIMRSKGGLNISTTKNNLSVYERNSSLSFPTKLNDQWYTLNYHFSFPSDDILVLKNDDNVDDIMTLDRKK